MFSPIRTILHAVFVFPSNWTGPELMGKIEYQIANSTIEMQIVNS